MTTAVLSRPGRPRSLLGRVIGAAARSPKGRRRVQAAAAAVREHVTTVAALAAIDYGAFTGSRIAGWAVLGVSLLVFDWKIQG